MKRELEFRFWDKDMGKFTDHGAIHIDGDIMARSATFSGLYDFVSEEAEEKIIIEQYTGLDDINGTPIYEGDILGGIYQLYVDWCNEYGGFAMYGKAGYCYYCSGDMHWYEVVGDENIEVIGNIHEDSHLLD